MSYYIDALFNPKNSTYIPVLDPLPNSTISPSPHLTITPREPTENFAWPENAVNIATKLKSVGFKLYKHQEQPLHHSQPMNGNNHHYGREQYEHYIYHKGWKPECEDETTGFPDLKQLLIPEDKVETSRFLSHAIVPSQDDAVFVVGLLHLGPWSCSHPQVVFGGMLLSLADNCGYIPYYSLGRSGVTASLSMDFKTLTPINQVLVTCMTLKITDNERRDQAEVRWGLFDENLHTLYCDSKIRYVTPSSWKGLTQDQVDALNATRSGQ